MNEVIEYIEAEGYLNVEVRRRTNGAEYIAYSTNVTVNPSRSRNVIASVRVRVRVPARALEIPVATVTVDIPEQAVQFRPDVAIELPEPLEQAAG